MLIAVGAAEARLAYRFGDRLRLEDGPVEILIALLQILQYLQGVVEAQGKHLILRLQQFVFFAKPLNHRRID